jgi:hypothetical protein
MDKVFKYYLLKYRPSYLLDEQVNLGVLFFFPEDDKVQFVYPAHLSRLTALYPDADLGFIQRILASFQIKAMLLSDKQQLKNTALDFLIEKEFFVADANSFFFSKPKSGIYSTIDTTVDFFKNQYLAYYTESLPLAA